MAFCQALAGWKRQSGSCSLPITNRRYGRLQVCVTCVRDLYCRGLTGTYNAEAYRKRTMNKRQLSGLGAGGSKAAMLAVAALGLAIGAVAPAPAQEATGGANSPGGQSVTAYLDYRDVNYSIINWSLGATSRAAAFKKEPAFSGGKVVRGTLQLGGGNDTEMGFAWDRAAGKLYLDLNRNQDLTDDPARVYSRAGGAGDSFQFFSNVHLPIRTAGGDCQALVDLNFYGYSPLRCSLSMRSFWQGKVVLQGEEWQVGLLGNPYDQRKSLENGNLLLRPWSERNRPFTMFSGSLESFPFSRNLFFGNRAYQLQCASEGQGDKARVRLAFVEQTPSLGELRITGSSVRRVVMSGQPYAVVLDWPAAAIKVPTGSYGYSVWLKKGEAEAYLARGETASGMIAVNDRKPAVLMAGGPLTNSVAVSRRGRNLSLNYELVGAGGKYQVLNQDRAHPPEFAVYQGEQKVASGRFEFG